MTRPGSRTIIWGIIGLWTGSVYSAMSRSFWTIRLVSEEGPVSADTAAIFVRLSDVVGTDRDKPAIANLHLTMEFKKPFSLSAVLGAESAAAEDEHHGMLALQVGELPAFRRVIGEFVVGENGPWNNVRSHMKSPQFNAWRINLAFARKRDKLS